MDLSVEDAPPEYLVDGYIEPNTVNALSADTGIGKTWLLHDLTLVTGRSWLGRVVRQAKVFYVDEEMPARVVRSRFRALGLAGDFERVAKYSEPKPEGSN